MTAGRELTASFFGALDDLPSEDPFCTTVSVHDLMDGRDGELASTRVCAGADAITYWSEPGPLERCDFMDCVRLELEAEPAEPGPESIEPGPESIEPGPEADGVEGAEVAEVADAEWDRSDGGCAGGPAGWWVLGLGVVATRRRGAQRQR